MSVIDVVSDANVALKWFHLEGEEEVEESRELLTIHSEQKIALSVLDLTVYEVGNALLRGRADAGAPRVATVLESLVEICPAVQSGQEELRLATELAEQHNLTLYDATYAAVAQSRDAILATLDGALLKAGLGTKPSEVISALDGLDLRGKDAK